MAVLAVAACGRDERGAPLRELPQVPIDARADAPVDAPPAPCRPRALVCEERRYAPDHGYDYITGYTYRDDLAVRERLYKTGELTPFKEYRHEYDRERRKVRTETFEHDKRTFVVRYEYSGRNKQPTWEHWDTDGDGDFDKHKHYRYRRAGELFIVETDEDGDGRFELRREERRNAQGFYLTSEEYYVGGSRSKPWVFERDEHGHVTRMTQWYRDGRPDYWPSKLEHDACGNLLRDETDYSDDGDIDHVSEYKYDCEH